MKPRIQTRLRRVVTAGRRGLWRIDHGWADTVWELFVPDGVLNAGTPLAGHDAIREWGRSRVASTVRTFETLFA